MRQISGKIKAIRTRCRNGAKWNEITIDIDGTEQNDYIHKISIRELKTYSDARGFDSVSDLVGSPITLELEDAKAS